MQVSWLPFQIPSQLPSSSLPPPNCAKQARVCLIEVDRDLPHAKGGRVDGGREHFGGDEVRVVPDLYHLRRL